jgi:hypothetical protein
MRAFSSLIISLFLDYETKEAANRKTAYWYNGVNGEWRNPNYGTIVATELKCFRLRVIMP